MSGSRDDDHDDDTSGPLDRWVGLVQAYDDDAWAALANRGLLRRARKDLTTTTVTVVDAGDELTLQVGEWQVIFPGSGPAQARCSCPSPVTCQHVLAAGLWLAEQETGSAPPRPADPGSLHTNLLALTADELRAHAGTPGLRWARQFLLDLDEPPRVALDDYPVVTFRRPDLVVRFPSGGLHGALVEPSTRTTQRYQVAGVLAWQQAHGVTTALASPVDPDTTPARRTGRAAHRDELRRRLLPQVHELLVDLARIGVSHLSPAVHERLTTAAVSAQGAELHRLARLLRRLADEVDLLLGRSARADDLSLLDLTAVALALVTALVTALDTGLDTGLAESARTGRPEPSALIGEARTTYHPQSRLSLVGLGALPWRSGTGYQGLTCLFWGPEQRRFFTWTDARPTLLESFDPRVRWTQGAPWTGLSTPATSSGRLLALRQAKVSRTDRLSGVESTDARVRSTDGEELAGLLEVHQDFADLPERLGLLDRSPLDAPDKAWAWAVLAPAQVGSATFDPVTQLLTCPVTDRDGTVLQLAVPWSDLTAHLVGRLETLGEVPAGTLLVARVGRRRGVLVAEPLSLVHPSRNAKAVDALHFDPGPDSSLVARLRRSGTAGHESTGLTDPDGVLDEDAPPADLPRALVELRGFLEQQGQRGCAGATPDDVRRELGRRHQALRHAGWSLFGPPDATVDPAEALLRSLYLVQQCELLLD